MFILNAQSRDEKLKPKQLRRQGIIPAVLYGKNLEESLSIQIPQKEVTKFFKTNSEGSTLEISLSGKKHMALLREATYRPATFELEHLSFQALIADEAVESIARIVLVNREKVSGMIQQPQFEVAYKALPAHLIERVELDLEGFKIGDSIRVEDLEIAKDSNFEIITPLDTLLVSVIDAPIITEETEEDEDTLLDSDLGEETAESSEE
ncbi:MAG TPA: 50S ribosomal protein L25 [Oscillospiraceae bacterium]|nr:50S ribosomal protein L25 [Oscillospiraceae bacterium]